MVSVGVVGTVEPAAIRQGFNPIGLEPHLVNTAVVRIAQPSLSIHLQPAGGRIQLTQGGHLQWIVTVQCEKEIDLPRRIEHAQHPERGFSAQSQGVQIPPGLSCHLHTEAVVQKIVRAADRIVDQPGRPFSAGEHIVANRRREHLLLPTTRSDIQTSHAISSTGRWRASPKDSAINAGCR